MKSFLAIIGTVSLVLTVILATNRIELGSVAVAVISAATFVAAALTKELRPISPLESTILFELANHEKNEISISELNEKLKKRATAWDLSSPDLQNVLITAQQAHLISISAGIITIIRSQNA